MSLTAPRLLALPAIVALAACSNGDDRLSFDEYDDRYYQLYDESGELVVLPEDLPSGGAATYGGPLYLENETMALYGDLTLRANFDNDAISGRVDEFAGIDGTERSERRSRPHRLRTRRRARRLQSDTGTIQSSG